MCSSLLTRRILSSMASPNGDGDRGQRPRSAHDLSEGSGKGAEKGKDVEVTRYGQFDLGSADKGEPDDDGPIPQRRTVWEPALKITCDADMVGPDVALEFWRNGGLGQMDLGGPP